jgi:hypothetical protein
VLNDGLQNANQKATELPENYRAATVKKRLQTAGIPFDS